jgi:hypothetical protein
MFVSGAHLAVATIRLLQRESDLMHNRYVNPLRLSQRMVAKPTTAKLWAEENL